MKAFTQKAKAQADEAVRAVAMGILNSVVMKSPVGNPSIWKTKYPPKGYVGGRFRGNWQISSSVPAEGTVERIDASGMDTINTEGAKLTEFKAGLPIYLVNNLPYAIPLEYGHSTQAPAGMVRLTVTEFRSIVAEQVKAMK